MLRLLLRTLLVLFPLALHAQPIGDARPPLASIRHGVNTDANATFAIGLVRPGDVAYRQAAFTGDTLSISAKVVPEAAHVDTLADIFTVVRFGQTFYMIDANERPVVWDGMVTSLVPRYANVTLQAAEEFVLYDGVLPQAGEYRVFVGYKPKATGALYYTPNAAVLTLENAPAPVGQCPAFGGRNVPVWHTSATGIFTHAPFAAADLNLITNGVETNDARFSYQWVKQTPGQQSVAPINIYAPADGVLVRLRHKARNLPDFDSDDFDLFLLVACDPVQPHNSTIVRFNHITEPRADIRAAYAFGELGAPAFGPGGPRNMRNARFPRRTSSCVPATTLAGRAARRLRMTSTS